MGQRNGAVVALNPQTGEILAMVSKPDFDPNNQNLEDNWNDLVSPKTIPSYPGRLRLLCSGVNIKVATTIMALEKGLGSKTFEDTVRCH
jgi:peptidoglycan glycosyltransferase